LVAISDIVLIEQASTTTVTITYGGGKVTTITHATAAAGDEKERDTIESAVVAALATSWTNPSYNVDNLPYAVSGIAVA
jgi:hypothetical protein